MGKISHSVIIKSGTSEKYDFGHRVVQWVTLEFLEKAIDIQYCKEHSFHHQMTEPHVSLSKD